MGRRSTSERASVGRIRDSCFSLNTQRAARVVARHFDEAFRAHGLTSGQFSILMAILGMMQPSIGSVADLLAMDRTTLTANLKRLSQRGLIVSGVDGNDRRIRRLGLTVEGRAALSAALPAWERAQASLERPFGASAEQRLLTDLRRLAGIDT